MLHDDDFEAEGARLELRSGDRLCDAATLAGIAIGARLVAEDRSARGLARAAGLEVAHEPGLPASVPALLVGLVILLRRRTDARRETLAILHELAHYLLARAEPLHTHADVWALTLLLAAPPAALSALAVAGVPLDADHLAWELTLPRWAAEERLVLSLSSNIR